VRQNREEGIRLLDPTSAEERGEVAAECAARLELRLPLVVDTIDDRVASAYGALPDRLYLVGRGGRIAFQGEPGPWGFKPEELVEPIERELG
jgi:hypothetical protein